MVVLENRILANIILSVENVPEESCGFLFGNELALKKTILQFSPSKNIAETDRASRYQISPKDFLAAEHYALETHLKLIGIYHTHLNQLAIPSKVDTEFAFPSLSYLIISISHNKFKEIRCWYANETTGFEEENLIIKK